MVQRHPVEELVAELKARKTISKEQVERESKKRIFLAQEIVVLMVSQ